MSQTLRLYPLSNFTFSTKEAQPEEDPSVAARLQRLQNNYEDFGMRRTVEGVLVVHDHGHPHILMLQIANAFFKLPGDYLRPGEDEVDGLKRRLDERLTPQTVSGEYDVTGPGQGGGDWEIGEVLSTWYRPAFESYMAAAALHDGAVWFEELIVAFCGRLDAVEVWTASARTESGIGEGVAFKELV
ncbi:hypothetical protein QFC21_005054 [Naganishia friedmannii]|uniref:Uncharacterized protein n=1 Tax=Naganishia friedmannii TaxID=89922 RepID=A0ACC2VCI8_9TREE|nr:hypothetical protein QFC21_005054 [Naganishia friedmannii]